MAVGSFEFGVHVLEKKRDMPTSNIISSQPKYTSISTVKLILIIKQLSTNQTETNSKHINP